MYSDLRSQSYARPRTVTTPNCLRGPFRTHSGMATPFHVMYSRNLSSRARLWNVHVRVHVHISYTIIPRSNVAYM